jgi:Flp pilus assembly protein TadD
VGRATSQWEALLGSQCKKKSGDRLTCTTCHDPHGGPSEQERVSYYRLRCLECHGGDEFGAKHHPENQDCSVCHMARAASTDIAHEQVTDHLIRRRIPAEVSNLTRIPTSGLGAPAHGDELEAVGSPAGDRELGLAYAEMALHGDQEAGARAIRLLRRQEEEAKGARGDAELHTRLGFLEQVNGHSDVAAAEYGLALEANPFDAVALGDLALIKVKQHQYEEAERLLETAFGHDPVQIGAGLNLAIMECSTGNRAEALRTLERVLVFAPDNTKARTLAAETRAGKSTCVVRQEGESR